MYRKSVLFSILFFILSLVFMAGSASAVMYFVEAPPSPLTRGQEYDFVITIDTVGAAVSEGKSKVVYETQYLELVSVTNGNFFDSLSHEENPTGTIWLTGTNATAKTGTGNMAIIRFKLIAEEAGSTTLCSVSPVTEITPTTAPPASCSQACTTNADCSGGLSCINGMCLNAACSTETDCICPLPTTQPVTPTVIQQAGLARGWQIGSVLALALIGLGVLGIILL